MVLSFVPRLVFVHKKVARKLSAMVDKSMDILYVATNISDADEAFDSKEKESSPLKLCL